MTVAQPLPAADQRAIVYVKLVHTVVFAFMSACISVVAYSAVTGQISLLTWIAFLTALVEATVFVGHGWRCPLTDVAERLGATNGSVADLFVPVWFARRLPLVASSIYGTASFVVITRTLL
jgi:hypothetical protein